MNETLKLWFFRDLTGDQRLKLFGLFGLPIDEIGKVHGRQTIALGHIVRKLVDLVREESSAPAPKALVDVGRLARSIVTAACELDGPADPDGDDTISITMKDLEAVVHRHVTAALEGAR